MSGHTPGPWKIFPFDGTQIIINSSDDLVAVVYAYDRKKEEGQANARLIAAAPDLLAVCKEAEHKRRVGTEIYKMLVAAIAKAEGGP